MYQYASFLLISKLFSDVDIEAHFQVNQSRADEITIREDYGAVPALQDGFDLSFDASNAFLGPGFDQSDPSNATGRDAYDQSLQAVSCCALLVYLLLC